MRRAQPEASWSDHTSMIRALVSSTESSIPNSSESDVSNVTSSPERRACATAIATDASITSLVAARPQSCPPARAIAPSTVYLVASLERSRQHGLDSLRFLQAWPITPVGTSTTSPLSKAALSADRTSWLPRSTWIRAPASSTRVTAYRGWRGPAGVVPRWKAPCSACHSSISLWKPSAASRRFSGLLWRLFGFRSNASKAFSMASASTGSAGPPMLMIWIATSPDGSGGPVDRCPARTV